MPGAALQMRVDFRMFLGLVATAWFATACGRVPICSTPAQPAVWNGRPVLQFDRDIESCRLFRYEGWLEPFGVGVVFNWHEYDPTYLQYLMNTDGFRVEVTDRFVAGTTVQVTEFVNIELDHYFLALPDEAQAIEQGKAGIGWKRTGYGFTARQLNNSPITTGVHRFYGSTSTGQNSHFSRSIQRNRVSCASTPRGRWCRERSFAEIGRVGGDRAAREAL